MRAVCEAWVAVVRAARSALSDFRRFRLSAQGRRGVCGAEGGGLRAREGLWHGCGREPVSVRAGRARIPTSARVRRGRVTQFSTAGWSRSTSGSCYGRCRGAGGGDAVAGRSADVLLRFFRFLMFRSFGVGSTRARRSLFARPARANRTMIRGAIQGACRASAGRRSRPYGSSARCDAESRCSDFGRTDRLLAPRSFRRASRWCSSGPHPRPSTTR